MSNSNIKRNDAIKQLNQCYNDLSEASCHEQAMQIDCFIRGFAKASVVFEILDESEFSQIENSLNIIPTIKPEFLNLHE